MEVYFIRSSPLLCRLSNECSHDTSKDLKIKRIIIQTENLHGLNNETYFNVLLICIYIWITLQTNYSKFDR